MGPGSASARQEAKAFRLRVFLPPGLRARVRVVDCGCGARRSHAGWRNLGIELEAEKPEAEEMAFVDGVFPM